MHPISPGHFKCWNNHTAPKAYDVALGWFLTGMTFVSYAPQILLLLQTRSNRGISLFSQLVACVSLMASILNGVGSFWDRFYCCSLVTPWQCSEMLLSFIQIISAFACQQTIYLICLIAWPREKTDAAQRESNKQQIIHSSLFIAYMLGSCLCSVAAVYMNFKKSPHSKIYLGFDRAWGLVAGITTCIIYIPQIYTTWNLNQIASLSVSTLGIQLPGLVLLTYFQIVSRAGFMVWGPSLLSAIFHLILVGICVYFGWRDDYTLLEMLFGKIEEVPEPEVVVVDAELSETSTLFSKQIN